MPEESLLPQSDEEIAKNKLEVELAGVVMEVDINTGEVLRVVSSNPGDYLLYQPGIKINFVPQFH